MEFVENVKEARCCQVAGTYRRHLEHWLAALKGPSLYIGKGAIKIRDFSTADMLRGLPQMAVPQRLDLLYDWTFRYGGAIVKQPIPR